MEFADTARDDMSDGGGKGPDEFPDDDACSVYEPMSGDTADGVCGVDGHEPCFMCEFGPVDGHPGVAEMHSVLDRHGELSEQQRYRTAANVQCRLDTSGRLEPAQVAQSLHAHDKRHVLDTKAIASENLQLLRLAITSMRRKLQRRDGTTGETTVHAATLNLTMRAMKMQLEWLRCKPEGLPFTRVRRASVRVASSAQAD
jgi:hypothetical protein